MRDSISVSLRRLRREDVDEVVEIEREAFSPLWVNTSFKRDISNKYACYLVATMGQEPGESGVEAARTPEQPAGPGQRNSVWSKLAARIRLAPAPEPPPKEEIFELAGYVSVWYQGNEAHITEIAVRESLRGQGIGELLLIGSLRAAVEHGSVVMTLEARVSNFIAQRLYEKYSFKSVGIRKGYYSDNREDAVLMTTNPINTDEYESMFQGLQDTYESRWGEIIIAG